MKNKRCVSLGIDGEEAGMLWPAEMFAFPAEKALLIMFPSKEATGLRRAFVTLRLPIGLVRQSATWRW